jgi:hypothetical protein
VARSSGVRCTTAVGAVGVASPRLPGLGYSLASPFYLRLVTSTLFECQPKVTSEGRYRAVFSSLCGAAPEKAPKTRLTEGSRPG